MPRVQKRPRCSNDGCTIRPSFAFDGDRASRCACHKKIGMVNVSDAKRQCTHSTRCTTLSSYGLEGERATRCATHKDPLMIDVVNPKCTHDGCTTLSSYGLEGKRATRCVAHKEACMICVRAVHCTFRGCTKQPCFALFGERATRCCGHKTEGMTDVKNAKCVLSECLIRASYGLPGDKATRCTEHKSDCMICIGATQCTKPGCKTIACFGPDGDRPSRCASHKSTVMVDVANRRCKGPGDGVLCARGERAYQMGMCFVCATLSGVKKTRKMTEARCLKTIFGTLGDSVTSKEQFRVNFKCSDASGSYADVDAVLDTPCIRIMLEIDELAHSGYARSCEERRMENVREALLLQSDDARPIAWVRFNPDEPDGSTRASATVQKRRCMDAVAMIRGLISNPRNCVEYINYRAAL